MPASTVSGSPSRQIVSCASNAIGLTIDIVKQATVSGEVFAQDTGKALASGEVILREVMMGTNITNPTDIKARFKNGKFELPGVPQGEYLVEGSAIKLGYAPTFSIAFKVTEGIDQGNVTIRCTKGASLTSRVVDDKGARSWTPKS